MTRPRLDLAAARRLTIDTEPWLSCDDCFDQVDAAVEAVVLADRGLDPRFRAHLVGCPACLEEARSLAELVAGDAGIHPRAAVARFDRAVADARG